MSAGSRRERRPAAWWRELVAAQPRSGRTVAEFCAARGVGQASFFTWRKRLAENDVPTCVAVGAGLRPPEFAAVRVTAGTASAAAVEIALPGGTLVKAAAGCDPEWLARLAAALRSAGC